METINYPIPRVHCGAKTRTGGTCRQPAMKNGRCRLHGGKSKSGKEHGRYKYGQFTKEALEDKRKLAALLRETQGSIKALDPQHVNDAVGECTTIRGHLMIARFLLLMQQRII